MKKFLLLLIFIVFALNVSSQEKKNQINFSIGPSFAVGDFGDKSMSNKNAGMAGTGFNFYGYFGHSIIDNVEIGIKGFLNKNEFDIQPTLDDLNSSSHDNWNATNSYWSTNGILLGISLKLPTSENFVINFRLLGGYIHSASPESKFYADDFFSSWFKINKSSAGSFGYNAGAGFAYYFNTNVGFCIDLDYISANFKFDDILVTNSDGGHQHTYEVEQSCTIITTTIGIICVF